MNTAKSFHEAIQGKGRISIIAEIKRSSPSHGPFEQHTVTDLIHAYEKGGASAISVVTESMRFQGSLELLGEIHRQTKLPIIRKDFIQEINQIADTRKYGGSAILLIAHNLTEKQLVNFTEEALLCDLDVVIEVHDTKDISKISRIPTDPRIIIGINNRNLETLEIDPHHALDLVSCIDPKRTIIAESGFSNSPQLEVYKGIVDAALIGTSLLISENPQETLKKFTNIY